MGRTAARTWSRRVRRSGPEHRDRHGHRSIGGPKGTDTDTDSAEADVLHPDIEVDKTLRRGDSGDFVQGPIQVHVGDTIEYRFEVTERGRHAADGRVQRSALRRGHADGARRVTPIRTASSTTRDVGLPLLAHGHGGSPATRCDNTGDGDGHGLARRPEGHGHGQDSAEADVLHPDIEVDKKLRRAGDGEFVEGPIRRTWATRSSTGSRSPTRATRRCTVEFSDPRCDAGTLTGPTGDADTDGKLDVGETWTYTLLARGHGGVRRSGAEHRRR